MTGPSRFTKLCVIPALLVVSTGVAQTSLKSGFSGTPPAKRSAVADHLLSGFKDPPPQARLRCYWWWLNGHTDKATITRDLTEMKRKGYGGVLLVDANGANQNGNASVPAGPEFGSPAWRELYLHALRTANNLGLEVTLNITSGWNLGGPDVRPEEASKLLTWSRTPMLAGDSGKVVLARPAIRNGFFRQIAVLAYPLHHGRDLAGQGSDTRAPLRQLALKSAAAEGGFSMPDMTRLLMHGPSVAGEQDFDLSEVKDISDEVDADGSVRWTPPAGGAKDWEILWIGYTDSDARVSTSSGAWQGLAIDYLDPSVLDTYWKRDVQPLLTMAKPYLGKTLKYVATDSWELGGTNWTGNFRKEFRKRRGYDPVLYLPVVAGRIVGSRDQSTRFLADLRRTVGDLVTGHYDHMAQLAAQYGLGIQCESGGPHGAPLDALETFRSAAVPQTEYWAWSPEHRSSDADRFFVKEASSAAHIYGHPLAADEGMTSIGNQWNESLGTNLKPAFDRALTEGMNRLVWHEFTSSPRSLGLPGQEYFAGTHLNPNVTWWRDAGAFTLYLNRAQFLLQQGEPVVDALYYYGDNVPNFVRLKSDDPARVLPGFDYDVTDTDALLHRIVIRGAMLETPEGISYRALVLPRSRILPLAVLKLARDYVMGGGTLVGERPLRSQGIVTDAATKEFAAITDAMWSACEQSQGHHAVLGQGQLDCTDSARTALVGEGALPDFETAGSFDYVHRLAGSTDIYFVRNTQDKPVQAVVTFRVSGKQPELFDAVTGRVVKTLLFAPTADHRTRVALNLEPFGSVFVVFRHVAAENAVTRIAHSGKVLYSTTSPGEMSLPPDFIIALEHGTAEIETSLAGGYEVSFADGTSTRVSAHAVANTAVSGPWTLSFPPGWGAPSHVNVERLASWTESSDPGVRYFSGTATYRTTVHLTAAQLAGYHGLDLDLGEVHEVASVRINGGPAQVLWKAPYRLRVDRLLHPGANSIQIDVTNLWPNRLIGDAQSPTGKHYTWTNIRKYTKDSPLLPSGLLGPVSLRPTYLLPLPAKR
ncbi:glycosyl hydrolase [Edaphobacter sp.]|uniref:glycosyl hydrolase n=1 Tax=Edaphobacter sp. TaxID=1934404 RepID=UPI002DB7C47C|nr:glycosyl hydrolase [Edaphobacter sp.]HEU5340814.1 glycosyl hydrolase [Edaphobacter sp.]